MLTRCGVGTAVFGGMIAATALGVFVIPLPYIVSNGCVHGERATRRSGRSGAGIARRGASR